MPVFTQKQLVKIDSVLRETLQKYGSQKNITMKTGISQSQLSHYFRGAQISAKDAVIFDEKLGVNREILRPDLFLKEK